jgi:hypothetical protein
MTRSMGWASSSVPKRPRYLSSSLTKSIQGLPLSVTIFFFFLLLLAEDLIAPF